MWLPVHVLISFNQPWRNNPLGDYSTKKYSNAEASDMFVQYMPRNMHTVFALLCFVVVIHWLIFPYPPGLLRWHCGNLTIATVPAKQPWWIWINTSCEIIMNDYITITKQSTSKPCAYLLGYTVCRHSPVTYKSDICTARYLIQSRNVQSRTKINVWNSRYNIFRHAQDVRFYCGLTKSGYVLTGRK